ncbi:Hsp70 family protein [Xylanimonas protaetiae]|uniref:Tetratricopeptide repeat protein n=1 Tax=Xylanimonas protaetiae TaxID=2509457 RepID=A0A4P6F776_9MICO|nr:Hsp70 family protein [Xylanimonas protaetiae]QAY71612.1 tetratricopeptide repeat protein [Xylanimonas protaetiae]
MINWTGLFGPTLEKPRKRVVALGIDLGTTYTTVTRTEWSGVPGDTPTLDVVPIRQWTTAGLDSVPIVPSVVAVTNSGSVVVGLEATESALNGELSPIPGKNYFAATKNEIGLRRQYPRAPHGLQSPVDIAAHILKFVLAGVRESFPDDVWDRVVVTVPASFQLGQRADTVEAATRAGLSVLPNDLLDEPVAALLTRMATAPTTQGTHRVAVVDFGGGTCDVALLEHTQRAHGGVDLEFRGTSRYCRLGGSDLDRAIAVEHLLPRLAKANGVNASDWDYAGKAAVLIPSLAPVAEDLKIKLSGAMRRRVRLGQPYSDLVVHGSSDFAVTLRGATYHLDHSQISLSTAEFDRILGPYLDAERLKPRFGEYFEQGSVFAPLLEVLERTGWSSESLDELLLAGGSSALPPVADALANQLGVSVSYVIAPERQERQTEVGIGAGLQALALAISGAPLARAMSGEHLQMLAADGKWHDLIPANQPLPFPEGPVDYLSGSVSGSITSADEGLKVQLRKGPLTVFTEEVPLPAGTSIGDVFTVRTTMDTNQLVTLEIEFSNRHRHTFQIERPGTYVSNPNVIREKILELEAVVSDPDIEPDDLWKARYDLSELYTRVGHHDKAVASAEYVTKKAASASQIFDAGYVKAAALTARGQFDDAVATYEAAIDDGAIGLRFTLAYMLEERGRYTEALNQIERYLPVNPGGAAHALRGLILKGLGRDDDAESAFRVARTNLGDPATATSFERFWLTVVAKQLGDTALLTKLKASRLTAQDVDDTRGALPVLSLGVK